MLIFEFDPDKSKLNHKKHGIDFKVTQKLWDEPNLLEVQAKSTDELRYLIIGLIAKKHWSAIVTYRKDKVRIISVRRSRQTEVDIYES